MWFVSAHKKKHNKSVGLLQAGFSLVEFSVLLLVVGTVATMSISAGSTQMKMVEVTTTKNQLATIRDALMLYREKQGRFPCPARENELMSSTTYGWEGTGCATAAIAGITKSGNAAIGFVPFRTLGINPSVAADQWGNKITYAVDVVHTVSSTVGPGALTITDAAGNSLTQSPTMGKGIFAIISHGEDGNGAYPSDSATRIACGATAKDVENCDNDTTFMDDKASQSKTAARYYDDYVLWVSQAQINNHLNYYPIPVISMAIGWHSACVIKEDGTLWCWGRNSYGQIGDGTTINKSIPTQVSGGGIWKTIFYMYSGSSFCAIKSDDTLWCWGYNAYGRLGDGTTTNKSIPTQVSGGGSWKGIYNQDQDTVCASKTDDTLWCWGQNNYGQVGDGTKVNKSVPTQVSGGGAWKAIYNTKVSNAGYATLCGFKTDDTLWCWGQNNYGQVGDGTTVDKTIPTQVSGGGTWNSVEGNGMETCAIKSDDTLWCWGQNNYGQVGDGTTVNKLVPTQVSGSWNSVYGVAGASVCGIKTDMTLWCWGYSASGQLGNGSTANQLIPTQVSGAGTWKKVYSDISNLCAIKSDDTLWCWGAGTGGGLGNGSTADKLVPTQVSGGGAWKNVYLYATGFVCAVKSDDTLWCWGRNSRAAIGDGTKVDKTVPTQVSGGGAWTHLSVYAQLMSCGIKTDMTLWCWGSDTGVNSYVGNGSNIEGLVPTPVVFP